MPTYFNTLSLEIEDATGNQGTAGDLRAVQRLDLRRFRRNVGEEPLSVEFRLCTNESAWKLHATFFQSPEAQFSPKEVWRIPNLKIPAAGRVVKFTRHCPAGGVQQRSVRRPRPRH